VPKEKVGSKADSKAVIKDRTGFRVVVMGSWLLVANYKLNPNAPTLDYAKEFLLNTFNWLAEQESLVALAPRKPEHIKLELTNKQVGRVGLMVILLLPLITIGLGLIVWVAPTTQKRRTRGAEKRAPGGRPGVSKPAGSGSRDELPGGSKGKGA